jgi:CheY-like chemotaxis protein
MRRERRTNILLVDDDELHGLNVEMALKKARIDDPLFHAHDGLAGLEMLRDGTVPNERRLVLLDRHMPRMNGLEFLTELRKDPGLRNTSVVMLTGSGDDRDRRAAYGFNIAGYIVKPLGFVALVEVMSALHAYWRRVEMS